MVEGAMTPQSIFLAFVLQCSAVLETTGVCRVTRLAMIQGSAGDTLCALAWHPLPLHLLLQGHHVRATLLAGQALYQVCTAWCSAGPLTTCGADQAQHRELPRGICRVMS